MRKKGLVLPIPAPVPYRSHGMFLPAGENAYPALEAGVATKNAVGSRPGRVSHFLHISWCNNHELLLLHLSMEAMWICAKNDLAFALPSRRRR